MLICGKQTFLEYKFVPFSYSLLSLQMETKTVTIPNISCGHCKMRVEKALNALNSVKATTDVPTKAVTIEWESARTSWNDIVAMLEKIGYPPQN